MEVRSRAGTWLCALESWREGSREAKANTFETLSVTVPMDDEAAPYLVFPNEVWLYLGDYEEVVQKFTVKSRTERRSVGRWVTVECESLLAQLAQEIVDDYRTPETTDAETGEIVRTAQTVKNIVGTLLSEKQTQSPAIRLGKIDASVGDVTAVISLQNKSLLACLRELHAWAGGWFYVDTDRRLHWRRATGYDAGHWIRFGHNLTQIEVRTDYRMLATRLVGYGPGGETEGRLSSTQNDSGAQSEYGVIQGVIYQDHVNEQESLDDVTAAELARRATPAKSYSVGVVNLAAVDPDAYNFEAGLLWVGTRVGMFVDAPEVEIETTVMAITWDLDRPLSVEISLSDPEAVPTGTAASDGTHGTEAKTLFDYIADAIEETQDKANASAVAAVGAALDPPTNELGKVWTDDNATERLKEEVETEYGTEGNEDTDAFTDALWQRLIDALTDSAHPMNAALREAFAVGGESNRWEEYEGS